MPDISAQDAEILTFLATSKALGNLESNQIKDYKVLSLKLSEALRPVGMQIIDMEISPWEKGSAESFQDVVAKLLSGSLKKARIAGSDFEDDATSPYNVSISSIEPNPKPQRIATSGNAKRYRWPSNSSGKSSIFLAASKSILKSAK